MPDSSPKSASAKKPRVTIADIANKLGVSTATVSLALRDNASVALETREKVKAAAQDLGYIYDRTAAGMRSSRSGMIGLIANNFTNSFMASFLEQIEDRVESFKSGLLIGSVRENLVLQRGFLERFLQFRVDGLIISTAAQSTVDELAWLKKTGMPVVQAIREIPGLGFDFIGSDNAGGTGLALDHLFSLGHSRIACIGGRIEASTNIARFRAYGAAMAARGLDPPTVFQQRGDMSFESGVTAAHALLDLGQPPTAILCFNDSIAFGVSAVLRQRGLETGRDISVVAFDDTQEARLFHPALTAVASGQGEIGAGAIEMLFERIADPDMPARRRVVQPSLIVRASTAPPPAA